MPPSAKFKGLKNPPKYQSEFLRFMNPLLDVLRDKGGQARQRDIYDVIADRMNLTEEERSARNKVSGGVQIRKSDCLGSFLSCADWIPKFAVSWDMEIDQ